MKCPLIDPISRIRQTSKEQTLLVRQITKYIESAYLLAMAHDQFNCIQFCM